MRLAWKNAHWSPTLDWFWLASERWYWAQVISLEDLPARKVATIVRMTGVEVRTVSKSFFFSGGGASGIVGSGMGLSSQEGARREGLAFAEAGEQRLRPGGGRASKTWIVK